MYTLPMLFKVGAQSTVIFSSLALIDILSACSEVTVITRQYHEIQGKNKYIKRYAPLTFFNFSKASSCRFRHMERKFA
jgi:hypothetical protein